MRAVLLLLLPVLMTACTTPALPRSPVQPFFTSGLSLDALATTGGFRPGVTVTHPTHTRYASVRSTLPLFGLLAEPDGKAPAFAVQPLAERLPLEQRISQGLLQRLRRSQPALAAQARDGARARWVMDVRQVAIFSKDVRDSRCEGMWFMQASLVSDAGRVLWRSGYVNNRLDEMTGYDCARLGREPALATELLQAALDGALDELARRVGAAT